MKLLTVADYRRAARAALTPMAWRYFRSGADAEATLRENVRAWSRWQIWPRVLVAGRAEVLVDGGVRWGSDVLKALALGARAVLLGRPILWGLAVGGEAGVQALLELVRAELSRAMALAGCRTVREIGRDLVRRP